MPAGHVARTKPGRISPPPQLARPIQPPSEFLLASLQLASHACDFVPPHTATPTITTIFSLSPFLSSTLEQNSDSSYSLSPPTFAVVIFCNQPPLTDLAPSTRPILASLLPPNLNLISLRHLGIQDLGLIDTPPPLRDLSIVFICFLLTWFQHQPLPIGHISATQTDLLRPAFAQLQTSRVHHLACYQYLPDRLDPPARDRWAF